MDDIYCYFADGNECHGVYHFPIMRNIFSIVATGDASWFINGWNATPLLPQDCWFFFLRCHDELTLEMASEREKELSPCTGKDLISGRNIIKNQTCLEPYEFCWISLSCWGLTLTMNRLLGKITRGIIA